MLPPIQRLTRAENNWPQRLLVNVRVGLRALRRTERSSLLASIYASIRHRLGTPRPSRSCVGFLQTQTHRQRTIVNSLYTMEMESTVDFGSNANKVEVNILEEKKDDDAAKNLMQQPEQQQRQEPQVDSRSNNSDATNADDRSQKPDRAVGFGSVIVREYERVIDSTSVYMGLALGWDFNESAPMPLQDKSPKAKVVDTCAKNAEEHTGDTETRMKRTNGSDRYGMMLRYGYKQKELRKATDEAAKFFKQRQREAARSLVVADERKKDKDKKKPLFGSMFRR